MLLHFFSEIISFLGCFLKNVFESLPGAIIGGFLGVMTNDWLRKPQPLFKISGSHNVRNQFFALEISVSNKPRSIFGWKIANRDPLVDCVAMLESKISAGHVSTNIGLPWRIENSSAMERKKSIFSGSAQVVRIAARACGSSTFRTYSFEDSEYKFPGVGPDYADTNLQFTLVIRDSAGREFRQPLVVRNAGTTFELNLIKSVTS